MRIWVVAALTTAATITAVAAAYAVGTLIGVQVASADGNPPGAEAPPSEEFNAVDLSVHDAVSFLAAYDPRGVVAVHCPQGSIAVGGGRLGSGSGLVVVDQAPVIGSAGAARPIGWRVEVERSDLDHSPRTVAAYVVCRVAPAG